MVWVTIQVFGEIQRDAAILLDSIERTMQHFGRAEVALSLIQEEVSEERSEVERSNASAGLRSMGARGVQVRSRRRRQRLHNRHPRSISTLDREDLATLEAFNRVQQMATQLQEVQAVLARLSPATS